MFIAHADDLTALLHNLPDGTYEVDSTPEGLMGVQKAKLKPGFMSSLAMPKAFQNSPLLRVAWVLGATAGEGYTAPGHHALYLGVWTDDDGTRYFDVSVWFEYESGARAHATYNRQAAYWDLLNSEAIRTGLPGS